MQDGCEGCHFNREMRAWGERFMACWHEHDTGQELYQIDGRCSGYMNPNSFTSEQLTLF